MRDRILRTLAEVRSDRAAMERQLATLAKLELPDDASEADRALAAWAMHHAYSAFEQIIERTVRTVEGSVPSGPASHRELLKLASLEIPGVRPRLLSQGVRADLQELLDFRHFVRHGYGADLDPERLRRVQAVSARLAAPLSTDLDALEAWLGALAS